ncbi:hypothetical protein EW145_g850 [Phellinidium pouzarii]|uniref:tRNA (adenine(58)-N(1))-methyltransferase catalytic subunit TRM61 n=1 Tax=Phellinidium pouzarii TaxID=167371 RepID=A0A4S4LIK1_9AGAM|nr:hypothetical protein EW145_g850 [Phellinidium pouzarii]
MWSNARDIAAGDLIIVWLTRDAVQSLVVTPGKEFNGKFGVYRHADLVGLPYGSKVGSRNGKGFIHVLRPTPELWTIALPHRTQILYLADIAFVVSYLNIKPGSQVVEAGTGSGSFSHSVARTIGSKGHLYSYEFHETRANKARDEFHSHGLADSITLTHRNVCKDGFTIVDQADSVFLDLPAPWEAIAHAKNALRKDRTTRICCFSPCMEQVLRTVTALNEAGFTAITMYETLIRPHEVHALPTLRPISEASAKLKQSEVRRENKRLKQIAASQAKREKGGKKRKRDPQVNEGATQQGDDNGSHAEIGDPRDQLDAEDSHTGTKKVRTEGEEPVDDGSVAQSDFIRDPAASSTTTSEQAVLNSNTLSQVSEESVALCISTETQEPPASPVLSSGEPSKMVVSRIPNEVRGHTSYLTFAVLLPTVFHHKNRDLLVDDALTTDVPERGQGTAAVMATVPMNSTATLSSSEDVELNLAE